MSTELDEFVEAYVEVGNGDVKDPFAGSVDADTEIVEDAFVRSLRDSMEYHGPLGYVSLDKKSDGDFDLTVREGTLDDSSLTQTLTELYQNVLGTPSQPEVVLDDGVTLNPSSNYAGSFERLEGTEENNTSDNLWSVHDLSGQEVYRVEDIAAAKDFYLDHPEKVDALGIGNSDGERVAEVRKNQGLRISVESSGDEIYNIAKVVSTNLE